MHATAWTRWLLIGATACGGAMAPNAPMAPGAAAMAPGATTASGGSSDAGAAPPTATLSAPVCEGPGRRRELDFWLGSWEVRNPKGAVVGHNRIESIHGGCAILETWTSVGGGAGSSLNFYDPSRSKWRQVWVDRTAGIIELEGTLLGGAMVLEGTTLQPDGTTARLRGTWTPMPNGEVRQVFEEANSDGTWTTTFNGLYARTAP